MYETINEPSRRTRTVGAAALRRVGVAAAAVVSVLTLLMLPRVAAASPEDRVHWGLHRVSLEHATVVVDSHWELAPRPTEDPDDAVPLATPLPAGAEVTGARPQTAADGTTVALLLPSGAHDGGVQIEVRMPLAQVERGHALPVPVPLGHSIHRVVLDPALSFSPDPALGLVAQVGHYAAPDIDVVQRHRFDSRTDGNLRNVGAYYVRGTDLREAGALRGEVALSRRRMGRAALVAGGLFGVVVLGMVLAHRRLGRSVRYERAEAYLEQELRALEDEDSALDPPAPSPPAPSQV
ncbi:MAG: hypothetical protein AB1Z98_18505 [Nannocystaceae bacterium]